ncbi:hypothetical protein [Chryseobacterium arthrosphaerae]|uniref:hypothetical protein n=1 Tax=Chryseobacterium arthrosphaerae TaxID=651561 RepID=UPI001F4B48A4|nr:hypothetical protein [Chryseobacterium arthrosphaerae]
MKKIFIIILTAACLTIWGQVGINTTSPSATLHIISKQTTADTRALEVNNSDAVQLMKLQDNGNMGINIGNVPATAVLHAKTDVRHENLPVLQPPYIPLAMNASGAAGTSPVVTKYFYFKRTTTLGNFALYDPNVYTNIPFSDGADVLGNTANFGFGVDVSGTLEGQPVNDVNYLVIPEPGVYLFEMYQTAYCLGLPTTSSDTGQIMLNTVFGNATNGSSAYTINTVSRDYMIPRRNASGAIIATSYSYANPQKLAVTYQSTTANEKVALFINYAGGDKYSTQSCMMNQPNGSDNYGYLIVTRL